MHQGACMHDARPTRAMAQVDVSVHTGNNRLLSCLSSHEVSLWARRLMRSP